MFARSTDWRHADGRTWQKKTSIRWILPAPTSRFEGLMSRWARPASQSDRISAMPLAITVSSTGASSISLASSMKPVTNRYSRSGVISANPYASAVGTWQSRRYRACSPRTPPSGGRS